MDLPSLFPRMSICWRLWSVGWRRVRWTRFQDESMTTLLEGCVFHNCTWVSYYPSKFLVVQSFVNHLVLLSFQAFHCFHSYNSWKLTVFRRSFRSDRWRLNPISIISFSVVVRSWRRKTEAAQKALFNHSILTLFIFNMSSEFSVREDDRTMAPLRRRTLGERKRKVRRQAPIVFDDDDAGAESGSDDEAKLPGIQTDTQPSPSPVLSISTPSPQLIVTPTSKSTNAPIILTTTSVTVGLTEN